MSESMDNGWIMNEDVLTKVSHSINERKAVASRAHPE